MNETLLQILVQSGAVGSNILLIIVVYKIALAFNASREADTDAKIQLAESITKLSDKIESCPYKARQIS